MNKLRALGFLLLCLLVLSELSSVDARRKKKGEKAKVEKDETKEGQEKKEEEKPKKREKKWSELTKEDWDRMERDEDDDGGAEIRKRMQERPTATFDPSDPTAFMRANKKGKPAMIFVNLHGSLSKKQSEDLAFKWKNLLTSAAIDTNPYVIEPGQIMWTVMDGSKGYDVMDFVFTQQETKDVTWDSQKYTKEAWTLQREG